MNNNEINPFNWNNQPVPEDQWQQMPAPASMPPVLMPPSSPYPVPPGPNFSEPFAAQPMPAQSAPYPAEFGEPVVRESILSPSTAAAFSSAPAPDAPVPPAPQVSPSLAYPSEQYAPEQYAPEQGYPAVPAYQPEPAPYDVPVQNSLPYVPAWQQPTTPWQPIEPTENTWNGQPDIPQWQPIDPNMPQPFPKEYGYPVTPPAPAMPMPPVPPSAPFNETMPPASQPMPDTVPSPYVAAQLPESPAAPAQESMWTPPDLLPSSEPSVISEEEQMSLDDETVVDEEALGHVAVLCMDDGEEISVIGSTVLGRVPIAPADYTNASVCVLHDESKRMSKTHALISFDDKGVYVRDLGARNGVRFEIDGSKTRIPQDEDVLLPEGARVHLGGRSFTVRRS